MSYKYSTGSVFRGDIYFEDDRVGQPTYIDFGMDTISIRPSGSAILNVSASNVGIGTTAPDSTLHVAGSTHLSNSSGTEVLKIAKADGDSREIVFENEGADAASIYLNSAEHLFIRQENSSNDLCLRIASTNALRVDGSASTVGIWTDAPVTGFDVHFNSMAMANDTGGGWVVKFGSGTLTAGKLYYLHTDGAWTETDADAASSGGDQLLGIALGSAPGTHGVLLRGFFDAHTYLDTHSAGKAVYIGTTAANMTTTAPSATGDIIRIIGYCTPTSKVIYFNPSSTFVELS